MKVYYQDEYGDDVYIQDLSDNVYWKCIIASPGDSVMLNNEEWWVASRTFYPDNGVVISISQNPRKNKDPEVKEDRLNEMKAVILDVQQKQNKQEKRIKALREQAMDIRSHIREQDRKNKPNDVR